MAGPRVLVVDDEPGVLSSLKTTLTLEGYEVDVAGNLRLARERLSRSTYDVLMLDVALPDGDGVTFLETLRAGGAEVPVIVMSGHATVDAAVRATRLGALDFMEKPLSTDRLLVVLSNTLRLVRAEEEARELREAAGHLEELLGESAAMRALREQVARAAPTRAPVLITGERGTGKELVARALHRGSERRTRPLEKLNCAAVPKELIESELFGHEAGAFTGATRQRRGKFERAHGGTLFLDEVGDMPLDMQAKLLRVLQEREVERVGGSEVVRVDVRVVAATNRDLVAACQSGAFRPDLYDRLNVLPIQVPPLRARREDIPRLANHFLEVLAATHGRRSVRWSDAALRATQQHSFPGNVRELRNLVERLVILTPSDAIGAEEVQSALGMGGSPGHAGLYRPGTPFRVLVEEAERTILEEALTAHGGQMAATARALGLERSHLYKKARALGLRGDSADDETR